MALSKKQLAKLPICIARKDKSNTIAFATADSQEIPNMWRKPVVTYCIAKGTMDMSDLSLERKIINLAFEMWAIEIPLKLVPVKLDQNPDIKISFLKSSEDDYFAKDNTILAWSGYPETQYQGILHFNDDNIWSKDGADVPAHVADPIHYPDPNDPTRFKTYNLNQTARHEIGHLLGEVHIEDCPLCVMYPYYNQTLELQDIEITRITNKYGKRTWLGNLYNRIKAWFTYRSTHE